ncbi:UNVERIFIED_ORG: MucR family transcriptional regulator [Bacillus sp. AZ43]
MLHPVGELPARVYWRRRAVVLLVLLAVLGGAGWLGVTLLTDRDGAAASDAGPAPEPALERVVPSLGAVATPGPPGVDAAAEQPVAAPAGPAAGGPCADDMITVEVRAPGSVAAGSKPTFELAVANVSAVPCVRSLDKQLQEFVLTDGAGVRVWGSNDCFPETSSDPRTLAPGEVVTLPLVWGGLTSEPTCTAPRRTPAPGTYLLRARLDTKVSAEVPLTVG